MAGLAWLELDCSGRQDETEQRMRIEETVLNEQEFYISKPTVTKMKMSVMGEEQSAEFKDKRLCVYLKCSGMRTVPLF